jgi:uncharacterized protein YdaU (DUF1376 family)
MPLYVADYIADTLHLTTLEHGAYLLLLMAYWRRGEPLPDDNKFLAKITNLHHHRWVKVRKCLEVFFEVTNGVWIHKRLEKEILRSSARSAAGVRANSERWSGRTPSHSHSHKDKKVSIEAAPEPERPKTRGSRLPENWIPSSEVQSFAVERLGVEGAAEELDKFRDYWLAAPGQKGLKLDWDRTWRNWCRNSHGGRNGQGRSRALQDDSLSASKAADRLLAATARGEFTIAPRPSLLPTEGQSNLRLLPKR